MTVSADPVRLNSARAAMMEAAKQRVEAALASPAFASGALFSDVVSCGPRLWSLIKKEAPSQKGSLTLMLESREWAAKWGLHEIPLESLDETTRAVVKAESGRIPIEAGVYRKDETKTLAKSILSRYVSSQHGVRTPLGPELNYLWMMVPYDLEDPLLVMQMGSHRLLVEMDQNLRIFWIDLLPDELPVPSAIARRFAFNGDSNLVVRTPGNWGANVSASAKEQVMMQFAPMLPPGFSSHIAVYRPREGEEGLRAVLEPLRKALLPGAEEKEGVIREVKTAAGPIAFFRFTSRDKETGRRRAHLSAARSIGAFIALGSINSDQEDSPEERAFLDMLAATQLLPHQGK